MVLFFSSIQDFQFEYKGCSGLRSRDLKDHSDHHKENTDLWQQLSQKKNLCDLKPSVMNGCRTVHIKSKKSRRFSQGRCKWTGHVLRKTDDNTAWQTLIWNTQEKRMTAKHLEPRNRCKDTIWNRWRYWLRIRMPGGIMLGRVGRLIDWLIDDVVLKGRENEYNKVQNEQNLSSATNEKQNINIRKILNTRRRHNLWVKSSDSGTSVQIRLVFKHKINYCQLLNNRNS